MTEISLFRYPIQEGKKEIWLNWCDQVTKRKDEVLATLREEGMLTEACFIDSEEKHVYIFVRSNDLSKAFKAGQTSSHKIDKEHKENRLTSLLEPVELKQLFYYENSKDSQ